MKNIFKTVIATLTRISPTLASRVLYFGVMHRVLNLKEPTTFSEKLMKLKLDNYNHNPTVWQCVDKLHVREYVRGKGITEENLPKLLGTYSDANEIDFDSLPSKFALKCTHGAGFNIICTDKSKLDKEKTIKLLNKWLKTTFGLSSAETHYGKVPPSIICEQFIESPNGGMPNDYKVYCFDGVPMYVLACVERTNKSVKINTFDLNWNDAGFIKPGKSLASDISPPVTLGLMLEMAAAVSRDFPFVRVDFYEDKGVPILGEMTFTPHACVNHNTSKKGQIELGKLIKLENGL